MARSDQTRAYPLFIEPLGPNAGDEAGKRNTSAGTVKRLSINRSKSDSVPRWIIGRLRSVRCENAPASRRANTPAEGVRHGHTSSHDASAGVQNERSAFASTAEALRGEISAFGATSLALRQGRRGSIQQRRQGSRSAQGGGIRVGGLTLLSPTARQASGVSPSSSSQARGRPAGPMIWLPEEQVWLLADGGVVSGSGTRTGAAYPRSAPLAGSPEYYAGNGDGIQPFRRDSRQESSRLARSDSSPVRSQFLSLMKPEPTFGRQQQQYATRPVNHGFLAEDWTVSTKVPGLTALEEDAAWYAEQQSRASQRRDQDRFSPMFQAALTGVDIPVAEGFSNWAPSSFNTASPTGGLRRSSTVGSAQQGGAAREKPKRSSSLRSRVTTVGNEDDTAVAASINQRVVREQMPRRRRSDGEYEPAIEGHEMSPFDGGEELDGEDWLASLAAQGIVPDGLWTPIENAVSVSSSTAAYRYDRNGSLHSIGHGSNDNSIGRIAEEGETESREAGGEAGDETPRTSKVKRWVNNTTSDSPPLSPTSVYADEEARERLDTIAPLGHSTALRPAPSVAERGRSRFPSVSTIQDGDGRDSVDLTNAEVSPVSSRGFSVSQ